MKSKMETTLNEQDTMSDMLECEKQLMNFYAMAMQEGSTERLRSTILKNYSACGEGQFMLFSEMVKRGYYEVQPVDKTALDKKIDTFQTIRTQLS